MLAKWNEVYLGDSENIPEFIMIHFLLGFWEIALNLWTLWGIVTTFTILNIPITEQEMSSHSYWPSLNYFSSVCSFHSKSLAPPWLKLFLSIFFFLMLLVELLISFSDYSLIRYTVQFIFVCWNCALPFSWKYYL